MFLCYRHLYGNTVGRTEESCAAEERKRRGVGRGGGGGLLPLTQHYSYSTQKNMDRTLIRRASNAAAQIYCNHGHTGYCFIYVCVLCTHLCRYCSDTDPTPVCVCALCTLTFPTDSVNTKLVLLKSSCSKEKRTRTWS